jgi:hypothetical protein
MKLRLVVLVSAVTLGLTTPAAFADPIVITGGSVSLGVLPFGPFPPFGVQLFGNNTAINALTFNQASGFVTVGRPVDLSSRIGISTSAHNGPFDQLIEGTQFHEVLVQGTLDFAATPFVPSLGASNTTPFTMSGQLLIFDLIPFERPGALLRTAELTGSGTAGIGLGGLVGGSFTSSGLFFHFSPEPMSPTPDPSTLLLVSGGLLAVLRKRWRM